VQNHASRGQRETALIVLLSKFSDFLNNVTLFYI
jgi:hypothetical protein